MGGIARLFFKETLDLPDIFDLQRFCNRLEFVPETRAYPSYVAVNFNWKSSEDNSLLIPTIANTVLSWLRQFNQQPPVCDWSLEPEIITLDHQNLFDALMQVRSEEGVDSEHWRVGLH